MAAYITTVPLCANDFFPQLCSQTAIQVLIFEFPLLTNMQKTTKRIFSYLPSSLSGCGHIYIAD